MESEKLQDFKTQEWKLYSVWITRKKNETLVPMKQDPTMFTLIKTGFHANMNIVLQLSRAFT